jgi:hypothetical protein
MEYRTQLTGWQAAVVAAVILGVTVFQCSRRIQPVDDAARQTLQTWLVREYQGKGLKQEVERYLKHKAGDPAEAAPAAPTDQVEQTPEPTVEFVSLNAHGLKDILVVRAEIKMNDGPPSDGRPLRYFSMVRGLNGNWLVFGDATSYDYYRALLSPALPRRNH